MVATTSRDTLFVAAFLELVDVCHMQVEGSENRKAVNTPNGYSSEVRADPEYDQDELGDRCQSALQVELSDQRWQQPKHDQYS